MGSMNNNITILKKVLCIFVLITFSQNLIVHESYSQVQINAPSSYISPQNFSSTNLVKTIDVNDFVLPFTLGEIRHSFKGKSNKIILHIQDAHCNKYAQKKISDIVEYINSEYGVKMINLEGGSGKYSTDIFTSIKNKENRKNISGYFMETGDINGAEFFAVNNPEKVSLWGVEDAKLYKKNLLVYRKSLVDKEKINAYLKELTYILNNLKYKIFTPDLLKLDISYSAYKAGNADFKEYLGVLVSAAKDNGIELKKLFNVFLISQVIEMEDDINFKKADTERSILIDELKKKLSRNEQRILVEKVVDFKKHNIKTKAFYSYLLKKVRELDINKERFPELSKYIVYISIYDSIDYVQLMHDLESLEREIKDKLYKDDVQKELDKLSRNLAITKNIFGISISRLDYEYYLANEDDFSIENYMNFIDKYGPENKIYTKPSDVIKELDGYRRDITKFYEYSFDRDKAFMRNLKFGIKEPVTGNGQQATEKGQGSRVKGQEVAVLLTGGFHTDSLCELFRKEGISYVSMIPKFRNEDKDYESPYFDLLGGKTGNLEKEIRKVRAGTSSMAIAARLSPEIAREVYGDGSTDVFRLTVTVFDKLCEMNEGGIDWVRRNVDGMVFEALGQGKLLCRVGDEDPIELEIAYESQSRSGISQEELEEILKFFNVDPEVGIEKHDQDIIREEGGNNQMTVEHKVWLKGKSDPVVFYVKKFTGQTLLDLDRQFVEIENEKRMAEIACELGCGPRVCSMRLGGIPALISEKAAGDCLLDSFPSEAQDFDDFVKTLAVSVARLHKRGIVHGDLSHFWSGDDEEGWPLIGEHIFWRREPDGNMRVELIDFNFNSDISYEEENNGVIGGLMHHADFMQIKGDILEIIQTYKKAYDEIMEKTPGTDSFADGNLIGKVFDSNGDMVTSGIHAAREKGVLVFRDDAGEVLYIKDSEGLKEARIRLTGETKTTLSGQKIYIIENNSGIRGFGDSKGMYLVGSLAESKIALFHELGEQFYGKSESARRRWQGQVARISGASFGEIMQLPYRLPEGVNSHTFLRGCGRRLRGLIRRDGIDITKFKDDIDGLERILREKLGDRYNPVELALIKYNIKNAGEFGLTGSEQFLYGIQDRRFGEEKNREFTEYLHISKAKKEFRSELSEIKKKFRDSYSKGEEYDFAAVYADMIDKTLVSLAEALGISDDITIVAMGSYARRATPYGTDLDLMLLVDPERSGISIGKLRKLTERYKEAAHEITGTTMDLNLIAGDGRYKDICCRTFEELEEEYLGHFKSDEGQEIGAVGIRALQDWRRVSGPISKDTIKEKISGLMKRSGAFEFLRSREVGKFEIEQISNQGDKARSFSMMSADIFNIKKGGGGLRNVDMILWAGRALHSIAYIDWEKDGASRDSFNKLVSLCFLSKEEAKAVESARKFLVMLRTATNLALESMGYDLGIGSKDVLREEIWPQVAVILGVPGREGMLKKLLLKHMANVRNILRSFIHEDTESEFDESDLDEDTGWKRLSGTEDQDDGMEGYEEEDEYLDGIGERYIEDEEVEEDYYGGWEVLAESMLGYEEEAVVEGDIDEEEQLETELQSTILDPKREEQVEADRLNLEKMSLDDIRSVPPGNLIGKVFKYNDDFELEHVTEGVFGMEVTRDGEKYLKLITSEDDIYVSFGAPAEFLIIGEKDLGNGLKAKIIEDNPDIRGFGQAGAIYIAESYEEDPIALFHEVAESYYAEPDMQSNTQQLDMMKALARRSDIKIPSHEEIKGINTHTFLRGCGKGLRELIKEKGVDLFKYVGNPAKESELEGFIKMALGEERFNPAEIVLIRYNIQHAEEFGLDTTEKLMYGLQDRLFGEEANLELTERLAVGDDTVIEEDIDEERSRELELRQCTKQLKLTFYAILSSLSKDEINEDTLSVCMERSGVRKKIYEMMVLLQGIKNPDYLMDRKMKIEQIEDEKEYYRQTLDRVKSGHPEYFLEGGEEAHAEEIHEGLIVALIGEYPSDGDAQTKSNWQSDKSYWGKRVSRWEAGDFGQELPIEKSLGHIVNEAFAQAFNERFGPNNEATVYAGYYKVDDVGADDSLIPHSWVVIDNIILVDLTYGQFKNNERKLRDAYRLRYEDPSQGKFLITGGANNEEELMAKQGFFHGNPDTSRSGIKEPEPVMEVPEGRSEASDWREEEVSAWSLAVEPLDADDEIVVLPIPDVHGDLKALREYLFNLDMIEMKENPDDDIWKGGSAEIVQLGDMVDRGTESFDAFKYIRGMQKKARESGGDIIRLLGNHELAYLIYNSQNTLDKYKDAIAGTHWARGEKGYFWENDLATNKEYLDMMMEDIKNGDLQATWTRGGTVFSHGVVTTELYNVVSEGRDLNAEGFVKKVNDELIVSALQDDFSAESGRGDKTAASAIFSLYQPKFNGLFDSYIRDFNVDGEYRNKARGINLHIYTGFPQVVGHSPGDFFQTRQSSNGTTVVGCDVKMSKGFYKEYEHDGNRMALVFKKGKVFVRMPPDQRAVTKYAGNRYSWFIQEGLYANALKLVNNPGSTLRNLMLLERVFGEVTAYKKDLYEREEYLKISDAIETYKLAVNIMTERMKFGHHKPPQLTDEEKIKETVMTALCQKNNYDIENYIFVVHELFLKMLEESDDLDYWRERQISLFDEVPESVDADGVLNNDKRLAVELLIKYLECIKGEVDIDEIENQIRKPAITSFLLDEDFEPDWVEASGLDMMGNDPNDILSSMIWYAEKGIMDYVTKILGIKPLSVEIKNIAFLGKSGPALRFRLDGIADGRSFSYSFDMITADKGDTKFITSAFRDLAAGLTIFGYMGGDVTLPKPGLVLVAKLKEDNTLSEGSNLSDLIEKNEIIGFMGSEYIDGKNLNNIEGDTSKDDHVLAVNSIIRGWLLSTNNGETGRFYNGADPADFILTNTDKGRKALISNIVRSNVSEYGLDGLMNICMILLNKSGQFNNSEIVDIVTVRVEEEIKRHLAELEQGASGNAAKALGAITRSVPERLEEMKPQLEQNLKALENMRKFISGPRGKGLQSLPFEEAVKEVLTEFGELLQLSGREGISYNPDSPQSIKSFVESNGSMPEEKLEALNALDIEKIRFMLREWKDSYKTEEAYYKLALMVYESMFDREILKNLRPGKEPRVVLIEVSDDRLLYEGTYQAKGKTDSRRVLAKKYGVNLNIVYYKRSADDKEIETEVEKTGVFDKNKDGARLIVFADSAKPGKGQEDIETRLRRLFGGYQDSKGRNKLTSVVKGDFINIEEPEERFSHVTLAVFGMGLIEFSEMEEMIKKNVIKETDERYVDLTKNLKMLLMGLDERGEAFKNMHPRQIVNMVLSSGFVLKIKKIDYGEIRDFMDSEAAILRSL